MEFVKIVQKDVLNVIINIVTVVNKDIFLLIINAIVVKPMEERDV
jgi:hypothetical protein